MVKHKKKLLLHLVKNPYTKLHIRGLERILDIPVQTVSRLVEQLKKEGIVMTEKVGKVVIPKFSFSDKAVSLAKIAMIEEQETADAYIKRWIAELKGLKNADIIILFGSVLTRKKNARDVDVLIVASKDRIQKLGKEIDEMNKINVKTIHPVYQLPEDISANLKKQDKVVLQALNGVIIKGQEELMHIIQEAVQ